MLSKEEFKKEDLLSALQELDCSRNCPCCEYFSPDDIQKCQDPTPYAVDLLEEFIQDVFNPQPYKFEDLKPYMFVFDKEFNGWGEVVRIIDTFVNEYGEKIVRCFATGSDEVQLRSYKENRFFPVRIVK